jgi:hypothetical protein
VTTRRVVAIHQPNFLPWLGYFDKMARADVFILLDDAQQQKKGGSYTNRVRMLVGGEPSWVTVPIDRSYHGVREIREVEIDDSRPWRDKVLRTIEQSYSRAPAFEDVFPLVTELVERRDANLADYNTAAVTRLAGFLGLEDTEIVRSSALGAEGTATKRLIELTKAAGGTAYMSGGGAGGYQDDDAFEDAGIELLTQDFEHPRYRAGDGEHPDGLSVVDPLMELGPDRTGALLA